jgi:hypothetical protein
MCVRWLAWLDGLGVKILLIFCERIVLLAYLRYEELYYHYRVYIPGTSQDTWHSAFLGTNQVNPAHNEIVMPPDQGQSLTFVTGCNKSKDLSAFGRENPTRSSDIDGHRKELLSCSLQFPIPR